MVLRPLVAVIDDDESVRESLPDLLREFGYAVQTFGSAEKFLANGDFVHIRCLILDVMMPGLSGLDLQQELRQRRVNVPIVFITARADETLRQQLLQNGAVECLFKPFGEAALAEALKAALRAT